MCTISYLPHILTLSYDPHAHTQIFTLLEDNQVGLQTMLGSRFIGGVQAAIEVWEKMLSLLSETLDEWVTTQRNWMYLETIFAAEDIQKQLPVEAQKFQAVDKFWKATMKKTFENPKVCRSPTIWPHSTSCS